MTSKKANRDHIMRNVRCLTLVFIFAAANWVYAGDRTSADAYLANVPTLIKSEDYKTIEDLCKRALHADESCPSAHYHLGVCYEKNNKAREAVKEYQMAGTLATKEKDMPL